MCGFPPTHNIYEDEANHTTTSPLFNILKSAESLSPIVGVAYL